MDRAFQQKTNELVQSRVGTGYIQPVSDSWKIRENTVEYIVNQKGGDSTKVINLIKSIEGGRREQ